MHTRLTRAPGPAGKPLVRASSSRGAPRVMEPLGATALAAAAPPRRGVDVRRTQTESEGPEQGSWHAEASIAAHASASARAGQGAAGARAAPAAGRPGAPEAQVHAPQAADAPVAAQHGLPSGFQRGEAGAGSSSVEEYARTIGVGPLTQSSPRAGGAGPSAEVRPALEDGLPLSAAQTKAGAGGPAPEGSPKAVRWGSPGKALAGLVAGRARAQPAPSMFEDIDSLA